MMPAGQPLGIPLFDNMKWRLVNVNTITLMDVRAPAMAESRSITLILATSGCCICAAAMASR